MLKFSKKTKKTKKNGIFKRWVCEITRFRRFEMRKMIWGLKMEGGNRPQNLSQK